MTENKRIDRIYVDKKDIPSYDRLKQKPSPFANTQNKDVFLAAMILGYHEGIHLPLQSKEGYFRVEYLNAEEKAVIKSIAVATTGDLNVLLNEQSVYAFAEEYATGGISLLREKALNESYGSYSKKLESELLQAFEKIAKPAERKIVEVTTLKSESIEDLIKTGESDQIEFKSTLACDLKTKEIRKDLKKEVAIAVSAFMNSEGGVLFIGVDDNGNILGIDVDLKVYKNKDEFERTFTNEINSHIGKTEIAYTKMRFQKQEGKDIAVVYAEKSPHEVYLKYDGKESFFIRSGNASQQLSMSETNLYIREHWPSKR